MQIKTRNVNTAFYQIVSDVASGKIPTTCRNSRIGRVIQVAEPVLVIYEKPRERVLFNTARNCNPFFHLYEALWMLAGRNDVVPLAYYNKRMVEFSDDGMWLNGAYGFRWRKATSQPQFNKERTKIYAPVVDQLKILIDHLYHKPESRRAVLEMWNIENDLLMVGTSRDVCCNTCVYFSVEQGICPACKGTGGNSPLGSEIVSIGYCPKCKGKSHDQPQFLNMTVCNRSNDLIWGMLGGDYVHFSILQEYMAAHLGLEVGVYIQFTNNLHAYTTRWQPEKWLDWYKKDQPWNGGDYYDATTLRGNEFHIAALVENQEVFDKELLEFVERHSRDAIGAEYEELFFAKVAQPMCIAYHYCKRKEYYTALKAAENIVADDWRIAATEWITRREAKSEYLH